MSWWLPPCIMPQISPHRVTSSAPHIHPASNCSQGRCAVVAVDPRCWSPSSSLEKGGGDMAISTRSPLGAVGLWALPPLCVITRTHQPSSLREIARSGGVWCRGRCHLPLVPVVVLSCDGGAGAPCKPTNRLHVLTNSLHVLTNSLHVLTNSLHVLTNSLHELYTNSLHLLDVNSDSFRPLRGQDFCCCRQAQFLIPLYTRF
jgi:hypothetical protein